MKFHTSGEKNDKQFKRIGRKMGNLVAVMLGVSITVVVLVCVLMFYNLTMSLMQDVCVRGTNVLAYELQSYDGDDDKTALLDALKKIWIVSLQFSTAMKEPTQLFSKMAKGLLALGFPVI